MFRYKLKYVIEKSLVTTLDILSKVVSIQNPNDDQCLEYADWTKRPSGQRESYMKTLRGDEPVVLQTTRRNSFGCNVGWN